ncbi:Carbamate kinase [[Actinomadura] parvosata subsp. kistnae]|uniref:Carbamate kinase n=1 Tax=[Actinomadura] parvosata subsp. kistnae TaxID=1909395 RepID=A0A1U9ZYV5_9ACTN|nr:carbamate kinase [Nonomuraea sp. ATCC 55076]AQZ63132.1 carbamate kinase [Nonomuraea sp. ATCC 55076]SPL98769.1 Carbamate kinase [Actinomadura parvosata subsp. kistnae]
MRIVIALGGNALLHRGERADAATQIRNAASAAEQIARLATRHQVLVVHGNGPQVGLLAEESERDPTLERGYPLDTLVAETQGMIGYWLAQGIGRHLPHTPVAALVTQVAVDAADPAFDRPEKPIGPYYPRAEAERLAAERGWTFVRERNGHRRVVPSPRPEHVVELPVIARLLDAGTVVIAGGGGGAPVTSERAGVEAVVDKDAVAALLATRLDADLLAILTDVPCVYAGYGTPHQRPITTASPDELDDGSFTPGSMGPKIAAACAFIRATGRPVAIGALDELAQVVAGTSGTRIESREQGRKAQLPGTSSRGAATPP